MRFPGMAAAAFLAGLATPCAQAADGFANGYYVNASAGAYFREDTTGTAFAVNNHAITGPFDQQWDPGTFFSLAGGYRLLYGLRVETELSYAHYTLSQTVFGAPFNTTRRFVSGTDSTRYIGTLDLFYDLPFGKIVVPYIGGGVGGAHAESVSGTGIDTFNRVSNFVGGNATRGVGFVEGGINLPLSRDLTLVPAYRYIRFFGGSGTGSSEVAHIAKMGLQYSF